GNVLRAKLSQLRAQIARGVRPAVTEENGGRERGSALIVDGFAQRVDDVRHRARGLQFIRIFDLRRAGRKAVEADFEFFVQAAGEFIVGRENLSGGVDPTVPV